ncbi:MAG: septal ring lytic transglycosylase RlpA family protein [Rhodospirillales bacterium]|jgi:rare lipoprotein A|nr:septal ring lytic transglycosylase RlpA family protein [Rhodospirillales bacterium]
MTRGQFFKVFRQGCALCLCGAALIACAETEFIAQTAKTVANKVSSAEPASKPQGRYKVGTPYQIEGAWYSPAVDYEYRETGIASWYGSKFHGRKTANGERYNMNELTAAHRTLPMPSFVRVTNLGNGRSIVLRINDRGPFARGRIIDVSRRGAQLLGFERQGTARVEVSILADESRAIARRLRGQSQIASVGSPLTVDSVPTVSVSAETLPPPPGAVQAAERPIDDLPKPTLAISNTVAVETQELPNPVAETVSTTAVVSTEIYIQAGAFSVFENANRVRAMLNSIGNVKISQILVGNRDLYRVRVGPITEVETADAVLETVVRAGYNDARIIVVH